MAEKPEPTQKTQPKGKDDQGQPAKPIDIPVPKRSEWDKALRKVARAKPKP